MDSSWSEIQVKTLLNLLAPHPCLYDTYFAVYFTFEERQRLYEEICEKLRAVMPAVTVNQIKTKMKSLRRQFNQEMKLVQEAQERGKERKPDLWCYDLLKFLKGRCEGSSQSAEEFIVITDSDGLADVAEDNHAQGNPTKKIKCGGNLIHVKTTSKKNANAWENKVDMDDKRKRKIPRNESNYIQNGKPKGKAMSSESVHDDNYEGDIEDATVRSEKMPRPNAMFLVKYFQSLFSGELYHSNNEYLLNNTAGYSYCFGAKNDSVIPVVSQIIENDHISCHTDEKEELFDEQADYEELSDEKLQSLTYFIQETNNHLAFEYLRGEYYIIDTSKHIIHLQGRKMDARNKENRHETNFHHKYKHMNLSLPILKSARYVRLCPELTEDDSYTHETETVGENLGTLSHPQTSGRSIRDILNAIEQVETLDQLNSNIHSVTTNMMQTSHQETHLKSVQPVSSCVVNYLTHDENGTGLLSPTNNYSVPSWNKNIENDIDKFSMLKNSASHTESPTPHNHLKGSVHTNMNEYIIIDSESDEDTISKKNFNGMSQQIARDKYFFKKENEDITNDSRISPTTLKDQQQKIPPIPNWLHEKPHCSKSNVNGNLENRSSFVIPPNDKSPNCSNERIIFPNSTGNTHAQNVYAMTDAPAATNHVDDVGVQGHDFQAYNEDIPLIPSRSELEEYYARHDFFKGLPNNNVANQIQNQEAENGHDHSDDENDIFNFFDEYVDNRSELTYDGGYFNNSFHSQSENSSWQGSKDSGNGNDSPFSFEDD